MIIGSKPNIQKIKKQTEVKPCFEICDHKINMISDIKLLQIRIHDKFQWNSHFKQVKANAQ